MSYCPKCQKDYSEGISCPLCGEPLECGKICPHCSAPLPDDALFCPRCGIDISGGEGTEILNREACRTQLTSALYHLDAKLSLQHIRNLIELGESLSSISTKIILTIGELIRDNSTFYVSPFFDVKKIKHASFIPPALPNNNDLLFHCDSTLFGKGDKGFALSPSALYASSKKLLMLPYTSLCSARELDGDIIIFCDNGTKILLGTKEKAVPYVTFMLNMLSLVWRFGRNDAPGLQKKNPTDQRSIKENTLLLDNSLRERDINSCVHYMHNILVINPDKQSLSRHVISQMGNMLEDNSSFYIYPFFNTKKIRNALFVQSAMKRYDDVLLYYDKTTLGIGDEGFSLTSTAFYSSEKTLSYLPYSSMHFIMEGKNSFSIKINGNELSLNDKKHRPDTIFLLELIVHIWRFQPDNDGQE